MKFMRTKFILPLPVCLLFVGVYTFGQSPDLVTKRARFAGTWLYDTKRSTSGLEDLYGSERLEITYTEPEFRIVRRLTLKKETKTASIIFFVDNRGEANRPFPFNQDSEVMSNSKWKDDVLERIYAVKMYQSGKVTGGVLTKESYSVSSDGNTLTITSEIHADLPPAPGQDENMGKSKSKRVYKRQP